MFYLAQLGDETTFYWSAAILYWAVAEINKHTVILQTHLLDIVCITLKNKIIDVGMLDRCSQ